MGSSTRYFEYNEEDGWELEREDQTYLIFGSASATYTSIYEPATRWEPEVDEMEQDNFECKIINIVDANNNEVKLELTPEENVNWESYMSSQLDDKANDGDNWVEYDDYEPDYD